MLPLELVEGDYLSESERKVFYELKDKLSDEWTVIYSLRWVTDNALSLNQSNGECDFIILNPNYGILILEVKGGIINCLNGEWTSIDKNNVRNFIKDPEKQVNNSKYEFIAKLRREKVNPFVATAIWFPDVTLEKIRLPLSMPAEIVLDMNSFDNLEDKIINIYRYRAEKEDFNINILSLSEYNKVKQILSPTIKSKLSLDLRSEKLNMKYIELNEEQAKCFEQLEDNPFISIKGHAGTGKTVLAIKKALKDSKNNKRVLYVCYNTMLFKKVKEEADNQFEVYGIYNFAEEYLRLYHEDYYNEFQEDCDYDKMMDNYLKTCQENKSNNKMMFDTILVDEGQDFREPWFKSLYNFLNDDGSLYVFYDELQMLYEKFGHNNIDFLDIGVRYNLKRNMRNTDEISLSSLKVIGLDESKIMLKGIRGLQPEIVFAETKLDINEKLKYVFKDLKKQQIEEDKITTLIVNPREKVKYMKSIKMYSNSLVESVRKYKGLENDIIIIPDLNENFFQDEETKKLLYVAMSRAKVHVILIINTENMNRKQRIVFKKDIASRLI
jgi:hypothetical protein